MDWGSTDFHRVDSRQDVGTRQQGTGCYSSRSEEEQVMNDQEILHDISRKLSVLIHLQIEKDGGGRVQEHVTRLSRFGLTTAAIAEILGTTAGTVAVAKSRVKKKGR